MTTTGTVTIWCDAPGCRSRVELPVHQLGDARRLAKDMGWRALGAFDLCPIGQIWEHEEIGIQASDHDEIRGR
jgi:hypothetical protein